MEYPYANQMGLVQVYTGNGKGKSTAALGLALRATGHGFKVHIVQWLNGCGYGGDLQAAKNVPNLAISQFGKPCHISDEIKSGAKQCVDCWQCFVETGNVDEADRTFARQAWELAAQSVMSGTWDMVVLDEISQAIMFNLISITEVVHLMEQKPRHVELVLTGLNMPREIIDKADLVSDINNLKHPYSQGIINRRGIDF